MDAMPPATGLFDGDLHLEPLQIAHADEMVEVLASPSLYQFIGGCAPGLDELTQRYRRQVDGPAGHGEAWRNWVIRVGPAAAGYVQATVTERAGVRSAAVAWLIRPEFQGSGLATRAAAIMVAYLRAECGVDVVTAAIANGHTASEGVARRLGLTPTGRIEEGEQVWADGGTGHGGSVGVG